MCICFRSWCESRKLAKRLIASVLSDKWDTATESGENDDVALERGMFVLTIKACRLRVLDSVSVCHVGQEVWIPPLARCCLRSAIRLRIAKAAAVSLTINKLDG